MRTTINSKGKEVPVFRIAIDYKKSASAVVLEGNHAGLLSCLREDHPSDYFLSTFDGGIPKYYPFIPILEILKSQS